MLVDLDLDGQAVAVPAGDVGGVKARHGLGLDDEILEALIEGVAQVDGAVGVGRPVVEDVFGATGAGVADLAVEVLSLPASELLGSFTGRLAFMAKSVLGRFKVDFRSSRTGALIISPKINATFSL